MSPGSIEVGPRVTNWAGDTPKPTAADEKPKSEFAMDETFVITLRPTTSHADIGAALHHAILAMRQHDVMCVDSWKVGIDHERAATAASKNKKTLGDKQ